MQNKYEVLGVVGEGAYGIVYKCINKETKEIVAIKKFKESEDEIVQKTMKRELTMLKKVSNKNIVEFKEAYLHKKNLFLVFEFVDRNLLELLEQYPNGLDPELIKYFVFQMIKACQYLHNKNIIHRDIKPENLLIDNKNNLKVCDFGFARDIDLNEYNNNKEIMTDYVATRWYRAPELLITGGMYGPAVDYWAIGCIMGELVDGNPLFPGDNEIDQVDCIQKILGNLPEYLIEMYYENPIYNQNELKMVDEPEGLESRYGKKLSEDAIDFMKGLLELDYNKRLNKDNVFEHKYFKGYKYLNNYDDDNNNKNNENNDFEDEKIRIMKKIKSNNVNNSKKKDSFIYNKSLEQNLDKKNNLDNIDKKEKILKSENKILLSNQNSNEFKIKKEEKIKLITNNNKIINSTKNDNLNNSKELNKNKYLKGSFNSYNNTEIQFYKKNKNNLIQEIISNENESKSKEKNLNNNKNNIKNSTIYSIKKFNSNFNNLTTTTTKFPSLYSNKLIKNSKTNNYKNHKDNLSKNNQKMNRQKNTSIEEKKTFVPKKLKKKTHNNYNNNINKYLYDYDYSQKNIDLKNNINIINMNNRRKIKLPKLLPINSIISTRKNNRESFSNFNNIFKSKYEFLY